MAEDWGQILVLYFFLAPLVHSECSAAGDIFPCVDVRCYTESFDATGKCIIYIGLNHSHHPSEPQ